MDLGPFTLDTRLGRGGMGEVWGGRHRDQGLPVAVKVLTAEHARRSAVLRAFEFEVQAVAGLDHSGVVTVYDVGTVPEGLASLPDGGGRLAPGSPYLAMELARGGALSSRPGARGWRRCERILLELLGALAHAHARGVVHRDIKPGNVLLTEEGPGASVLLTDFGLAQALGGRGDSSNPVGTPAYMAPEQFLVSGGNQGVRTDLYALGCLAWWLITGAPPFPKRQVEALRRAHRVEPPPPLRPRLQVPEGVEGWLLRLLAKRPLDRYGCAADAAAALRLLPTLQLDDDEAQLNTQELPPAGADTTLPLDLRWEQHTQPIDELPLRPETPPLRRRSLPDRALPQGPLSWRRDLLRRRPRTSSGWGWACTSCAPCPWWGAVMSGTAWSLPLRGWPAPERPRCCHFRAQRAWERATWPVGCASAPASRGWPRCSRRCMGWETGRSMAWRAWRAVTLGCWERAP